MFKLLKKSAILLAVLLFFTCFPFHAFAADTASPPSSAAVSEVNILKDKLVTSISIKAGSKTALLNGKAATLDTKAAAGTQLLVTGKFLVEALGGTYGYDYSKKSIRIRKGAALITMKIGSKSATVNGKTIKLDTAPSSSGTRALLPARFVAENLGGSYLYDAKTKTAVIKLQAKYIAFPDPNLKAAILKNLNKTSGDVMLSDTQKVTALYLYDSGIKDINGIQYFTNLNYLLLTGTQVGNISPIKGLTKLSSLFLKNNKIADITPLSGLTSLKYLELSGNPVFDISPVSKLPILEEIQLEATQVSSVTALKLLPKLQKVNIWDTNKLEDALALELKARQISDSVIKPDMSEYQKELALYDYVIVNSKYDNENYKSLSIPEESHQAQGIILNGTGVCDGYAKALKLLLNINGLEAYVIESDNVGPDDKGYEGSGHAWDLVKIDGLYYSIDATWDDPVYEDGSTRLNHYYFNLSDNQMAIDHILLTGLPAAITDNPDFITNMAQNRKFAVTEDWIYGIFNNYIYRYKKDGSELEQLCEYKAGEIQVLGDYIFFNNLDDENKLYSVKTDSTDVAKLTNSEANYLTVTGDYLYFIYDYKLYSMRADDSEMTALSSEDAVSFVEASGDWIYYKGFVWDQGARLYRIKPDGSLKTTVISDYLPGYTLTDSGVDYTYGQCEFISGDYVYYANNSDGNKLYRVKTDGSERVRLAEDPIDPFTIELTGEYVYYRSTVDQKYYRLKRDGTERVCVG